MSTYTDGANISRVLNFVWSLHKSLFSMVKPVRSNNSSWYSLQSLRDTQAPPTNVKVTALGGGHHYDTVPSETTAVHTHVKTVKPHIADETMHQILQ